MPGVALVVWIAALVVYVALARWRGASWRSIAGLPAYAVSLAMIEFGVPPVVARHPGTDLIVVAITIVAVSLLAGWVLWLILRASSPAAVSLSSTVVIPEGVAGSMAEAIDRARSSPRSAMPEPAPPRG